MTNAEQKAMTQALIMSVGVLALPRILQDHKLWNELTELGRSIINNRVAEAEEFIKLHDQMKTADLKDLVKAAGEVV